MAYFTGRESAWGPVLLREEKAGKLPDYRDLRSAVLALGVESTAHWKHGM